MEDANKGVESSKVKQEFEQRFQAMGEELKSVKSQLDQKNTEVSEKTKQIQDLTSMVIQFFLNFFIPPPHHPLPSLSSFSKQFFLGIVLLRNWSESSP